MENRIIQGLMRCQSLSDEDLYELIKFDIENGINIFDLADIYGLGEVEIKVGRILKNHPELRSKMFIQSKCSIVKKENKYYDLSYEHIMEATNQILERLNITYLDSLLLHRPDILMDAKEIKKAFMELKASGKVLHFGVSNFSKEAIEYLNSEVDGMIEINQVQIGLGQMRLIDEEINFNMNNDESVNHSSSTLFYLKRKNIQIQAWSPFLVGYFDGSIFDYNRFPNLNHKLDELAYKYQVSKASITTNFLIMLDPKLYVVTGSMNKDHVLDCIKGTTFKMDKMDWYSLYQAAGHMLP